MQVTGIDERRLVDERATASFVAFIYTGGDAPGTSWSVHSYLLTDTQLPEVLGWLSSRLPAGSCWSLGSVLEPARPTPDSSVTVAWIIGSNVLNMDPDDRSPDEQRVATEMLARRHDVTFSRRAPNDT